MKKLLLTLTVAIFAISTILAQAPQAFKYQAIARDASGNTLADQAIGIKVNILQGSQDGPVVFSEIHQIQTNSFGLINIGIGKGEIRAGNFSSINWGGNSHYVRVEMDPAGGTNYKLMGTAELLSVPYALYADKAGTGGNRAGEWTNDGTDVYVDETTFPGAKVGIGVTNPGAKIEVAMQTGFNSIFKRVHNAPTANSLFLLRRARGSLGAESPILNGDNIGQIAFEGNVTGGGYSRAAAIFAIVDGAPGSTIPGCLFFSTRNGSGTMSRKMVIDSDGNVGIGTTTPGALFHVGGNSMIVGPDPAGNTSLEISGVDVKLGDIWGNQLGNYLFIDAEVDGEFEFIGGNVGIGSTDPGYTLDVNGSMNATSFYKSGSPLKEGLWSISGSKVYYTAGNVGIGNSNPGWGYKLSVTTTAGIGAYIQTSDNNYPSLYVSHSGTGKAARFINGNVIVANGNLGIGIETPGSKLHIWENSIAAYQIMIDQDAATGDAAIRMQAETTPATTDFTLGIDNDDDNNFEISNTSSLTGSVGTGYTDANTMMRINHARNAGVDGIIDFNHQSRARAFLSDTITLWSDTTLGLFFPMPWNIDWYLRPWFPIPFNKKSPQNRPGFDEHSEFTLSAAPPPAGTLPPWAFFTANEEGYYQVNARVEIIPDNLPQGYIYEGWFVIEYDDSHGMTKPYPPGYSVTKNKNLRQTSPPPFPVLLSIGIFVNGSLYAQGNNYQLNTLLGNPNEWTFNQYQDFMNAPNVSDVVYLDADDYVEIYVLVTAVDKTNPTWVFYWFPWWINIVGDDHGVFTFASVHKVS